MTRLLLLLIFSVMLFSCNDEEKAKTPNKKQTKEDQLKESIQKYPDSLIMLENLVQHYRETGRYDEALKSINTGIARDSQNPRLYDIRAILHYESEDTAAAIASFEKAVALQPSPEYLISLGTLYAQDGNQKALQIADSLAKHYTKAKKESLFLKGLYYASAGDRKKAISLFDQALTVSHTFMEAYREKALALEAMGKYPEALDVLDKALTLQNNYEEGYFFRGQILEKMGRKTDAINAYQDALMYAPDYIEARDALGRLGIKS